ncbi:MAG: CopY/TcrY family copper transport repressor [Lactobacillus sp.]|nr:CopY/TcrY family copper transport repressor [Lactobacillus sp.]
MELDDSLTISPAEWEIMRVIWTLKESTSKEIIDQVQMKNNWSDSTIKTLLRRLDKKGLLSVKKESHRFRYEAIYGENELMYKVTSNLLSHMCDMHKGALLERLLPEMQLFKKDIEELESELTKKAITAPDKVPCNCLHDMC